MGIRDELIKSAMEKAEYQEKIAKTKVSKSCTQGKDYRVPPDSDRDLIEKDVLLECRQVLQARRDVWWCRMEAPVKIVGKGQIIPSASKGLGDLMICQRGRLISVEVKRSRGGNLRAEQARMLAGIAEAGGLGAVVRSGAGLVRLLSNTRESTEIDTVYGKIPVY
jgi:hypothetical protein